MPQQGIGLFDVTLFCVEVSDFPMPSNLMIQVVRTLYKVRHNEENEETGTPLPVSGRGAGGLGYPVKRGGNYRSPYLNGIGVRCHELSSPHLYENSSFVSPRACLCAPGWLIIAMTHWHRGRHFTGALCPRVRLTRASFVPHPVALLWE